MGLAAQESIFNSVDYLLWEAEQTEKHEYLNGEVFAMAGAADGHITVSGNLYMALRQHLTGTPCRTYMADMLVNVEAANNYFYPDVVVTCSARDLKDPLVKSEPKLLIEVLSPSTESYDRGIKFTAYRRLPSLQEYVMIDIQSRIVDCYRLGADGLWVLHPFGRGETVTLASVALEVTAEQLFAEVSDE
jgi:Uma2 family endonuclease